jgi:hypothetical protein
MVCGFRAFWRPTIRVGIAADDEKFSELQANVVQAADLKSGNIERFELTRIRPSNQSNPQRGPPRGRIDF